MNSRFQRRSGIGWLASIMMLAVVLVANLLGAFQAPDGRIHDLFRRFTEAPADNGEVLLIQCNPAILEHGNPKLRRLLESIANSSPKALGVVSERAPLQIGGIASDLACPIVEGRPADTISAGLQIPTGFSELSFAPQPIFRFADQVAVAEQGELSSFERLLVAESQLAELGPLASNKSIGVHFGGVHSIPRLPASQILNQNYLPEMIRGRIVIVGEAMPLSSGIYTPASASERMSRLETRGHVVLSLLRGNGYQTATPLTSGTYLLLAWAALCWFCRHLSTRNFAIAMLGYTVFAIASAIFSSQTLSINLPITATLALAGLVPIWGWLSRFQFLSDNIASQNTRLNAELASSSHSKCEDPWQQIAPALRQFYPIERFALFQIAPGSQRLSRVIATGTVDHKELLEQRRDISRSPWKQSIDFGKACENGSRPVFKRQASQNDGAEGFANRSDDTEFIVPLKFGSKIFGFMILEVKSDSLQQWVDFERVVNQSAEEFASLIAHQRATQHGDRSWRSISATPERMAIAEIQRKQDSLSDSIQQIRQAFESGSCCRVLFDTSGHVLEMNSRMVRRLGNDQLSRNVGAVALIEQLSGISSCEAHRIFRAAILRDRRSELKTKRGSVLGSIVVSPVSWQRDVGRDIFSRGLLVEIFDTQTTEPADPTEAILQTSHELTLAAQESIPTSAGKILDSILQSAMFNAAPWLQKKNQRFAKSFHSEQPVAIGTCDALGSAIEVCLCLLSECAQDSETISIALDETALAWELKIVNGENEILDRWPTPPILGLHSIEHFESLDQCMRQVGGRVLFADGFNGQVVISVQFPVLANSVAAPPASSQLTYAEQRDV